LPKKVDTLSGEIKTKKPHSGIGASPTEQAAIVALSAAGEPVKYISEVLERSVRFVTARRVELAERIEAQRKEIFDDYIEDYTDIISLALFRTRERLLEDEKAEKIQTKELVQILKAAFDKRQLLRQQPTSITADADGVVSLEMLAVAETFNENFKKIQRMLIERQASLPSSEGQAGIALEGGAADGSGP